MEKKILHLTLKKKWFDMIALGEKKEEYREIKPYWVKRLFSDDVECNPTDYRSALTDMAEGYDHDHIYNVYGIWSQRFDIVRFKNGYAKNAPTIDVKCIEVTTGIVDIVNLPAILLFSGHGGLCQVVWTCMYPTALQKQAHYDSRTV